MGLAAVGAVAAVVSTAVSVVGAIQQGNAASAAAQANAQQAAYQAQIARNNQIIANQQAEHETEVGQEQAARKSQEGAAKQALTRAGLAASGVDVNTGSAKDVQVSERELNKLDAETVLSNAQEKAYGYRSQAANFGAQAGQYALQGGRYSNEAGYDTTAGYLKAWGTLASAASVIPWNKFGGQTTGAGGTGDQTITGGTTPSGSDTLTA
jgi:hypothetical protein